MSTPTHDSPERARKAALLIRILLLVAGGYAVAGIVSFGIAWVLPWQRVASFVATGLLLAAIRLVQVGHDRIVAWLLPILIGAGAMSSFINDAHEAVFLGVFTVAVLIAGLLLDPRAALVFGTGCVLTFLGGAFVHEQGHWEFARPAPGWGSYSAQAMLLGTAALLMVLANRGIEKMVEELRRERARLGETNRELNHTKARHEALLEQSFGGIVVVDADMSVVYCNAIAADLLQLPTERGDVKLDTVPGFEAVVFDDTLASAGPEQLLHLGDGVSRRPVGVRVGATTLANGEPGRLILLQDMAELEASEQDRGRLRAQLHQSQKMEALGRLAAGLAHDFNNILTVVIGNSDLLLMDDGLEDEVEESLRQIRDSSEKAGDLTRQLLAFGRQSNRTMEDVDIGELLRNFLPMLVTMVHSSIDVELELEGEAVVRVNPGELEQVLANLVINASDAMPDGGAITVRTERRADSVVIGVADTGEGMSEATQQRVFEPFFTTKGLGSGTGLGLAMVHGIVTSAGGELHVQSRLQEGTTIEMHFPAVDGAPTWSPAGKERRALTSLTGASILVVDDEPAVRGAMARMIEKAGAEVTTAVDGASALKLLESAEHFDLAVLDVLMPGMSGPALAAELRAKGSTIPILFVSGHVPQAEKAGILASSPHFLPKPLSPALLSKAIASALAEARSEAVPEPGAPEAPPAPI